jgi:hypothetical protein
MAGGDDAVAGAGGLLQPETVLESKAAVKISLSIGRAPFEFSGFIGQSRIVDAPLVGCDRVGVSIRDRRCCGLRRIVGGDHPSVMQFHSREYGPDQQEDTDTDQQRLGELGRDTPAGDKGNEVHQSVPSSM